MTINFFNRFCLLSCVLISFVLVACRQEEASPLFTLEKNTGVNFENKVVDGSIENSFYYRNYYNGGGVAIGDINNDGLCDVFLTSNMGQNALYLNKGDFKFEDVTSKTGMKQDSMWSTGVVLADINDDGWLDIYVCNSGHMKNGNRRNKLYINNHDLSFTESAAKYGLDMSAYVTHASFFDYDLDGDLDCFIINNSPMPINNLGYNNRRDLVDKDWPVSDFLKGGGDHLFRNDSGHFVEVSQAAGIHGTLMSFGLGVSIGDINMDNYPDVFVANDSYERDYLYINQKDGTFRDEMEEWIEQNSFSSMGADIADINNDGLMDIFTTDMLPDDDYRLKTLGSFDHIDLYNKRIEIGLYRQFMKNCLFVNTGNGKFLETANYSGVSASDWSWGALFFDADNDGYNDIFVCNGVNRDVTNLDFMDFFADDVVQRMVISGEKQSVDSVLKHIPVNAVPNKAFRNMGNLRFTDAGKSWGFMDATFSNGAAYGDLDNDGDLDLVLNNENQPAFLYRNNSREANKHNYIGIVLKGIAGNRYAIGSKISVHAGKSVFYREQVPSRGFQSSVDYKQIIGLGTVDKIDSIVIVWPNGIKTNLHQPALNAVVDVQQPALGASSIFNYSKPSVGTLLIQDSIQLTAHAEDNYIDFYYERNLPYLLSREGPQVDVADVNSDGLEDLYIGGAKGQPGQLYIQKSSGVFAIDKQDVFNVYADFEDVAVLFFDADKDGDADLFIGAGGNTGRPSSRELQHRLYKNDGKGKFVIDFKGFPNNDMNCAVAAAYDFDEDGDEDLFVGSRSVPYNYGITPQSYIYRNDGNGHFADATAALNKSIAEAGMITCAEWADITGDGKKELIIAGEWMTPRIFSFNKSTNRFDELSQTNLTDKFGWWQSMATGDINGDGKIDIVLGNIGENFYLRPDKQNPVKLWMTDFDKSGTTDQFLSRTANGRDVPVFLKREITEQFPGLKKQNLRHSEYAKKDMVELFGKEMLATAVQKVFNYSSSIVAINEGNGKFRIELLPMQVQLSSVNAIAFQDLNGDKIPDLILGGNRFTFPPQFGRLDASYGHAILVEKNGTLKYQHNGQSGMNIKGEVRDIDIINGPQRKYIVATVNNDKPVVYNIRK